MPSSVGLFSKNETLFEYCVHEIAGNMSITRITCIKLHIRKENLHISFSYPVQELTPNAFKMDLSGTAPDP